MILVRLIQKTITLSVKRSQPNILFLSTTCMYKKINTNTEFRVHKKFSSVDKLNEYIQCQERNFEKMNMRDYCTKKHEKLLRALQDLRTAIEKDRIRKEEAMENLKRSNRIMKNTILKLREEIITGRKDIQDTIHEFQELNDLNTERLLQIDPLRYLGTIR